MRFPLRTIARATKARIKSIPVVRETLERRYEKAFASHQLVNYYRGVFSSFEDAAASAPSTKPIGYDNEGSAALYSDWFDPMLKDYAAYFWIQRFISEGATGVFDLGGHIGTKYYAARGRILLPEGVSWRVCDVPAVTAQGARVAEREGAEKRLEFTTDPKDVASSEVVYASGSLQYLPTPLAELLGSLDAPPRFIVFNSTALHPHRSFFTLNSTGVAFCPYRVEREQDFIGGLEVLGYQRVDRWETPKDFVIPFHDGYDLDHFVGMALVNPDIKVG